MLQSQWILFLKSNKGKGKDITTLSKEYRELYKKTILYPYVRRERTLEDIKNPLCRGKSQKECIDAIKTCYWKPKNNNCSKRPDRSNQINPYLPKNASVRKQQPEKNVHFNLKPEVFPEQKEQKKEQKREIRTNRRPDECSVYNNPLECIANEDCDFVNGKCQKYTMNTNTKKNTYKVINMDDVWGI